MTADRARPAFLAVLLAVLVWTYGPALRGSFVDWDDPVWLGDPLMALGPGEAARAAFTTARDGVFAPLLRLAFYALRDPWRLHLYSLTLFLASAVGIEALLRRLGVGAWAAGIAVALWALHPTRVESVAWLTGLKDTQSLALVVAMALLLCPRDGAAPAPGRVALGTLAGTAALLTKAAVFPVPFVLAVALAARLPAREVARRVGPACAVAVALAAVGSRVWAIPARPELRQPLLGAWVHGSLALRLVPSLPAAIVPIPAHPLGPAVVGLVALGVAGAAAARWPRAGLPLLACWILPLTPFLGAVPMLFWAADRHLLVPSLAPAVLVGLACERALPAPGVRAIAATALALACAAPTARRVPEWHDSLTLWTAEVGRPGDSWARWAKLGAALGRAGRFADSERAFDHALALAPGDRTLVAHRLVASLAADGWTPQDAALVRRLEPPPATPAAWAAAVQALRDAGDGALADWTTARLAEDAAGP